MYQSFLPSCLEQQANFSHSSMRKAVLSARDEKTLLRNVGLDPVYYESTEVLEIRHYLR